MLSDAVRISFIGRPRDRLNFLERNCTLAVEAWVSIFGFISDTYFTDWEIGDIAIHFQSNGLLIGDLFPVSRFPRHTFAPSTERATSSCLDVVDRKHVYVC